MRVISASKFKEQCLALLVHNVPLVTRDRALRRSRLIPLA